MLTKILIGIAVVVVVFLVVVMMQPTDFRVVRTARIKGTPAAVFAQVNNFHNWPGWSPWEKLDRESKKTFEGPEEGKGASYSWNGNNSVGEGKLTITDSKPNEQILMQLEFKRPFVCNNDTEFTFKAEGDETVISWDMSGKNNFMAKMMGLFMNMDNMVGGQFEEGLENMKKIVETEAK